MDRTLNPERKSHRRSKACQIDHFMKFSDDHQACKFLERAGYKLTQSFDWVKPRPEHKPSKDEAVALDYLWLEWDYGDVTTPPSR